MTETTEAEPIWRGACRVYWRTDAFGMKDRALFVGGLHVGSIMHHHTGRSASYPDQTWRAWIMTDDDGKAVGWFSTEQEAKDALVDAAVKEILA